MWVPQKTVWKSLTFNSPHRMWTKPEKSLSAVHVLSVAMPAEILKHMKRV